ncbi:hypothetical protein SAMN05880580_106197 [Priestia flexa]|nr:hypothetical protein SAMN05880580_106197 [Priestia flexa]
MRNQSKLPGILMVTFFLMIATILGATIMF